MRRRMAVRFAIVLAVMAWVAGPVEAQRRGGGGAGVYKSRIAAHWFDDNSKFWYQNELPRGEREFIVVDAKEGTRRVVREDEVDKQLPEQPTANRAANESAPVRVGRRGNADRKSPDGKWTASIRDHNMVIRSADDGKESKLTDDGREGLAYGN
jgi:hypothetical protein